MLQVYTQHVYPTRQTPCCVHFSKGTNLGTRDSETILQIQLPVTHISEMRGSDPTQIYLANKLAENLLNL